MIVPYGDDALLVSLGDGVDPELNARAHAIARGLAARPLTDDGDASEAPDGPSRRRPVVGYASVLVPFDPARLSADDAVRLLGDRLATLDATPLDASPDAPLLEIPVRYGGSDGPDLLDVAERTGLTPGQVVDAHASTTYRVYLLGFVPGFAYLGILPAALELPRRADPRLHVPAGSVAIAGRQTAVYPSETPGGWHLIGRTAIRPWDPTRQPPALLEPGAGVRFVPAVDA